MGKRTFSSHFPNLDNTLRPFNPDFGYLLTDLADWSDEALMALKAGLVRNVMLMLKHYRDEVYTLHNIERLFVDVERYLESPTQNSHIKKFWVYLFNTNELKDEEFRKLFNRLSNFIKNEAMTTYQQILEKGKIEGKAEGNLEKENFIITNAFEDGFEISVIARLTGLSESEVKDRIRKLGLER